VSEGDRPQDGGQVGEEGELTLPTNS
jgi:hypothetical protein